MAPIYNYNMESNIRQALSEFGLLQSTPPPEDIEKSDMINKFLLERQKHKTTK